MYFWSVKFMKHTITLLLLVFLFIGNVGVNIFKHICEEDGVIVSYVFDEGEEQCDEHTMTQDLPECCHPEESNDSEDKGCCDDEVEYIKLNVEAYQQNLNTFSFPTVAILTSSVSFEQPLVMFDHYTSSYVNPPPPDSKGILLEKQVWII